MARYQLDWTAGVLYAPPPSPAGAGDAPAAPNNNNGFNGKVVRARVDE